MRNLFYSWYPLANPAKRYLLPSILFSIVFLFFSTTSFSQSGDLSQIRNGDGKVKVGVLDTCGSCWVNGNAGATNAHYAEGMSIAYRSLITGLEVGKCYEYELGYDTYHGAMAIDYLTHFQRLQPHGPLGHIAEVINPLAMVSGSKNYDMTVITGGVNTFTIPAPQASGIGSPAAPAVFNKDGSPRDISNQAVTSYIALQAAEKLMTIYNGEIQNITYGTQQTIILGGADAESRIKIRFVAGKDSVVLAWGGHIASRLDWGYTKDNKGKLIPLSAGGISGSPYHMRQKKMDKLDCSSGAFIQNITGIGNQDRSLSAAAVVPPPECPTVPSQTKCIESTSFTFTIASPEAGATYTWSFGSNTAGAAFSGSTTGNSVTIVPSGTNFTKGAFSLNITASLNFVEQVCNGVATGTVVQVVATASADPVLIDIRTAAHSTTLTADIGAASSDANNANYDYQWSIVTAGTAGSLTNATSRIATYTAGLLDASTTIQFKVIATQKLDPKCSDDEVVSVSVNAGPVCGVSPQTAVCQGTTTTHNGSPNSIFTGATYTWSLQAYGGGGSTNSTFASANGGTSIQVNAIQSYRIVLSQVYPNTAVNTSCVQDVTVVPTPTIATTYNAPACDASTFSVTVGSAAKPVVAGNTYSIKDKNGATISGVSPSSSITASSAANLVFSNIPAGSGYIVTVTTSVASCTASDNCGTATAGRSSVNENLNGLAEETLPAKEEIVVNKPVETIDIIMESATKVNAVPNPFRDRVRFNLVSAVSGRGSLELFNMMGQKVATVYEGFFQAGRPFLKEYNVPMESKGSLIYVFTVGDQKVTGKLIGLK